MVEPPLDEAEEASREPRMRMATSMMSRRGGGIGIWHFAAIRALGHGKVSRIEAIRSGLWRQVFPGADASA